MNHRFFSQSESYCNRLAFCRNLKKALATIAVSLNWEVPSYHQTLFVDLEKKTPFHFTSFLCSSSKIPTNENATLKFYLSIEKFNMGGRSGLGWQSALQMLLQLRSVVETVFPWAHAVATQIYWLHKYGRATCNTFNIFELADRKEL